jgi:glycosyltransferase involved in cell wall biosynthesis
MSSERISIKRAVLDVTKFGPSEDGNKSSDGPKTLLYVGRLEDMKNLPTLFRAFSKVQQSIELPRMKLVVVGYGRLESELKQLAGDLPNGGLIEFRGALKNSQTVTEYRKADVFILPSTREAWGLVALEAMCCELPVIVSERCGCARDLVNPKTGWQFDPFREQDLVSLLEQVSHMDRETLRKMGKSGRQVAVTYSPEHCASIILRTVGEVLVTE